MCWASHGYSQIRADIKYVWTFWMRVNRRSSGQWNCTKLTLGSVQDMQEQCYVNGVLVTVQGELSILESDVESNYSDPTYWLYDFRVVIYFYWIFIVYPVFVTRKFVAWFWGPGMQARYVAQSKYLSSYLAVAVLVMTGSSQMMPPNEGKYGAHSPFVGQLWSFTFMDTGEGGHEYSGVGSTEADRAEREGQSPPSF